MKALLVEDSASDRMIMTMAFMEAWPDDELWAVNDGEEAMGFLRKEAPFQNAGDPDVVLLDLNLPRKDGLEVLKEIRSQESLAPLSVIILTTSQWQADIHAAQLLNATDYWSKPTRYSEIVELLRTLKKYVKP